MQPRPGRRGEKRIAFEVGPARSDRSRKQIAHSAERHARIADAVFEHPFPVGGYRQRTVPLENDRRPVSTCDLTRGGEPVRLRAA